MATLRLDDLQLHYREAGTGAPVLLPHGTGADADMWSGGADLLAAGHRAIRHDRLRQVQDHGGSLKAVWAISAVGMVLVGRPCSLEHRPQLGRPATALVPLPLAWNHFLEPRAVPEIVAYLVVR
jgi:hypothetical protein